MPKKIHGPKPGNFVSRGPGIVQRIICDRPKAADVALIIEVSSTSRRKDKDRASRYTRLATAEYWMIDLEREVVTTFLLARQRAVAPQGAVLPLPGRLRAAAGESGV